MIVQNIEALLHEILQNFFLGQEGACLLGQMVMGRLQGSQSAMLPDHDMAVAGAGIELESLIIERFPDGIHQLVGFCGGDFAGRVIHDGLFGIGLFLGEGHHVAAENNIVRLHLHAHAEGFQGRSTGKYNLGVITHHRQIGHFTAGRHTGRHILHHTHLALCSQVVHLWGLCHSQGGLTAQCGNGLIGHAVAQNNNILHNLSPYVFVFVHDSETNVYNNQYTTTFLSGLQYEKPLENVSPT